MKLLITLLFGPTVFTGQAQQTVPSTGLGTHADSVATLRQVFRHHRRFARVGTFQFAPSIGFGVGALVDASNPTGRQALNLFALSSISPYTTLEIVNWHRYSKRREEEAVQRFEQHQPQPPYLQKRLLLAFTLRN